MAYVTEELEQQALAAIEKHKLVFIEDIVAYLPCNKTTFYEHKLNESNVIKEALLKVKTEMKVSMRSKWYESDNATLQISLMKLIAGSEERKRLSQSYTDVTTKGKSIVMTDEERENRIAELRKKLNDNG
jgi:hypothetical protein